MLVFIFCEIVLTWSSTCNPQFHYEYYVSSACFLVKRKWLVRISFAGNFHSISKKGVTHSYYKFGAYSSPSGLNARRKKKKNSKPNVFSIKRVKRIYCQSTDDDDEKRSIILRKMSVIRSLLLFFSCAASNSILKAYALLLCVLIFARIFNTNFSSLMFLFIFLGSEKWPMRTCVMTHMCVKRFKNANELPAESVLIQFWCLALRKVALRMSISGRECVTSTELCCDTRELLMFWNDHNCHFFAHEESFVSLLLLLRQQKLYDLII